MVKEFLDDKIKKAFALGYKIGAEAIQVILMETRKSDRIISQRRKPFTMSENLEPKVQRFKATLHEFEWTFVEMKPGGRVIPYEKLLFQAPNFGRVDFFYMVKMEVLT